MILYCTVLLGRCRRRRTVQYNTKLTLTGRKFYRAIYKILIIIIMGGLIDLIKEALRT